jgi:hypothetical protein
MSTYLVIENPASEAKTTAFASFDELKTWVQTKDTPKTLSEIYKSTMYDCIKKQGETQLDMVEKLLKACKGDIERKAMAIEKVEEALPLIDTQELGIYDTSDEEYRKQFTFFSQHPKFVHYYAKSWLVDYYMNKPDMLHNIHEYFKIFEVSCLPESKFFRKDRYFTIVNSFYKVFGRVLPELAYKYRYKYYNDVTTIYLRGNNLKLPDMDDVEEAWVQAFTDTYYEKADNHDVQRSSFVKHFTDHIDEFMNTFPSGIENIDYRMHYEKCGFPFASNPEKTIDLPMVRRSAGMFITGLRRKTAETDEIVKTLRERYDKGPICNDWKTIEPINPPKNTKTTTIYTQVIQSDYTGSSPSTTTLSLQAYKEKKFTLEFETNQKGFLQWKREGAFYGFSNFYIVKGHEMLERIILRINDREVDRIYPSEQPNCRFGLLSDDNFIPTACKVTIEGCYNPRMKEYNPFHLEYSIVELLNENEEAYRDFWYISNVFKGTEEDLKTTSQKIAIDAGYNFFIDSMDIVLSQHCNNIILTLDGTELPLQPILMNEAHMIEENTYNHWQLDMTKLFGQDTLNFSNINKALLKFNKTHKGYSVYIFAKYKNRIIFEKGGKMRLPLIDTYIGSV